MRQPAAGSSEPKTHGFLWRLLSPIGNFFKEFGVALWKGDIFVKLSTIFMGAGYLGRKKYLHALLMTVLEGLFIWFCLGFAAPYLKDLGTLGTETSKVVFDPELFKTVTTPGDNSFLILLYSVLSLVVMVIFVIIWMVNIRTAYRLQVMKTTTGQVPTLRDDLNEALGAKFHRTLLTLPLTGILMFTIIPLIVMICVAFTNYDQDHMPPGNLFTWVGTVNFGKLFSTDLSLNFSYAFWKILGWTLIWAVVASFTCYFGGILVALLINSKRTRWKGLWRTCFVVAMAVPQFVSLLLVRSFFANAGIVNTICSNIGLTELLKDIGLVAEHLNYIPFLSSPGWARFMIIVINIWVGVPYLLLMASGVLMNIPQDLYEAATIDGANAFQQFKAITMPYMLFVTGPYLINSVVQNINNFNVIYLLTNNVFVTTDQKLATANAGEVDLLVTWLFKLTNNEPKQYNMASVIGILVFVVCSIITLVAFNVVTSGDKEEAMQ